ncbi:tripartite-type tricarboxylate transporter receptor subunit TctC [Variovorax boronicumulans]|uniref:Bug family tripartite tricarboxylate transporter substrate binding protein n=1 Tax=Variovorax boronicumulans TaxID=436515 RepID=UPI00278716E8|nr:tripartite tricarboxylate transporter substrate-binding protein [Variovorax boronicumulans]MDP9994582.1 tripartite-type tricarboxylate transporter receptor subunit TctC [Variovorax boronicumulans]MDQ0005718.1 tripartite-type tricarboxylate transporter receptor subunit TctC [Variovorax boronicumulans]MDQ0044353.1 tripartite-type tricarboxylate transporter receptor subunit TctC [Variovorax boronicumulans]
MHTYKLRRREVLVTLALSQMKAGAFAQANFPDKPIRLVVPYPPGGAAATQLTLIQAKILKNTGANLVLDYKPGASGNIGVDTVLKSRPDGYTIGWAGTGSFAIIPHLLSKLPYDVSKDVQYITAIGSIANVLVASTSLPANNLRELVELSKKEDLSYALASVGSTMHLAMEAIIAETGLKVRNVPYKGEQPALLDVIPGRVPLMLITLPGALEYLRGGKLKALGVTSATRSPLLPNVPTLIEQGFKDLEIRGNFVFFGPAGIPPSALQWLQQELARAIDSPDVKGALADLGTDAKSMSVANTTALVRAEDQRWGALVKKLGIKWD